LFSWKAGSLTFSRKNHPPKSSCVEQMESERDQTILNKLFGQLFLQACKKNSNKKLSCIIEMNYLHIPGTDGIGHKYVNDVAVSIKRISKYYKNT
jgi:hypothetical protein